MKTVLITGAAGRIGGALRAGLGDRYALRLLDRQPITQLGRNESFHAADVVDLAAMEQAMAGADAVVHMAAAVSPAGWGTMFEPNFIGTYNTFEAARRQGVKRIVYASSIHAHGFYRREIKVGADTPPRPDSIYGVSKVFGEAIGRLYADKHGLEVVCLRIASCLPRPTAARHLATWLSHEDCTRLVDAAIAAKDVHFEVIYGVSRNTRRLYHDPNGLRLGYQPQDDAEDFAAEVLAQSPVEAEPEMDRTFHGAFYTSRDFSGDLDRIS